MLDMTPKKALVVIVYNIDQTFLGFLNFSGNSIYELPGIGL